MPNVSESKRRANAKWDQENMERLVLKLRLGVKDKLKAVAENSGQSLTMYLIDAFSEKAVRDGIMTQDQADAILSEDREGKWVKDYLNKK